MTKLTKNEKILRKASKKWENFLAEGAFNNEVDLSKQEDDEFQYNQAQKEKEEKEEEVNEARMGEYGKIDAEDGNPPTKIGRGNEEYMAAYNAVLVARGEEPLDIQKPDQAYLDALRSGQLQEAVKTDGRSPSDIELVDKVAELMTSDPEFRILSPYVDKFIRYSKSGGAVESSLEAAVPEFVAGRHIVAIMKKAQSGQLEETVRKAVAKLLSEGLTPEQVKEKIIEEGFGDFLRKGADFVKAKTGLGMTTQSLKLLQQIKTHKDEYFAFRDKHYPDSSDVRNFIEFVEQNARKQAGGGGGMRRDDAWNAMTREKRKTMEFPAGYTGKARKIISKVSKLYYDAVTDGGAHKDKTLRKKVGPAVKALEADLEKAKDYLKQLRVAVKKAQKSGNSEGLRDVYEDQIAHERYLEKTQAIADAEFAAKAKEAERKRRRDRKKDDDMEFTGGQMSTKSRYAEEKKNIKEEVIEDFAIELEDGLTFADVEEAGLVTPGVDSVIDNGDGYAQVYAEPGAMAKMAKTLEAMTGVMVSPESHGAVDEEMSKKDFVRMVRDKGKVPNLKGDMGPISGLEGPFQYRSGAVLYYDPREGKYYDRGQDRYLDDQEAAELTMEDRTTMSSDPEFDQVQDIAADMLELSARSRIPVSLKSVQSALEKQAFDAQMEKGMLIVDNKYVIADKKSLPATAQKISFTGYGIDYLSNLQGEQQDLPIG